MIAESTAISGFEGVGIKGEGGSGRGATDRLPCSFLITDHLLLALDISAEERLLFALDTPAELEIATSKNSL